MKTKDISAFKFRKDIPAILIYQFVSKLVFFVVLAVYRSITGTLLWNLGRPAFTSGDLPYLLRSWQGWVLILLGFVLLVIYAIFDINATILISNRIINREPLQVVPMLKEATAKMKNFRSFPGLLVILYVSLIAPFTGTAIGISLTRDLEIPDFIMSFINGNFILRILYTVLLIVLLILGVIYVFTFHFGILEDMPVKAAMKASKQLMKANWKEVLKRYFKYIIKAVILLVLIYLVFYQLPGMIVAALPISETARRACMLFYMFLFVLISSVALMIVTFFLMFKMTLIFRSARSEEEIVIAPVYEERRKLIAVLLVVVVVADIAVSVYCNKHFDELFPAIPETEIVAHRAGGTLANENTVLGIEAAAKYGAKYAEIDVQRTKDGYYVINHDDDFERCCGDPRKPGEMTLAEVKKLRVKNSFSPLAPDTEVATMEEILDAARGKIGVYIELKGESADEKMAEDVYQMVVDRDMVKEVKFISMKYDLLNYVEQTHPDVVTGYLCYFSFGDIEEMNVDELLLEAETATDDNIEKIQDIGKKINIWTVNSAFGIVYAMAGDANGIITDEVEMAVIIKDALKDRPVEQRILGKIL